MRAASVLEVWSYEAAAPSTAIVLPDGCRDLILRTGPNGKGAWFISTLADSAQAVPCLAGDCFHGFRFRPGAAFSEEELLGAVANRCDHAEVEAVVADLVRLDARVAEALDCLSLAGSVTQAARLAGVTERGLERLVVAATGRTPVFWRSLARGRRAAADLAGADLAGNESLAAVAADNRYCDQAHMTREFRRWFGTTPAAFRASPALMGIAVQSGYGISATGVHNSTRKSSMSAT